MSASLFQLAHSALQASRRFYTPLSLAALTVLLVHQGGTIWSRLSALTLSDTFLILSLMAGGQLAIAACSYYVFRFLGEAAQASMVFDCYIRRLPTRYLPGGIWHSVSRAVDISSLGVSSGTVGRGLALEILISCGLAAFLGGSAMAFASVVDSDTASVWALLALAGMLTLVLGPLFAGRFGGQSSSRLADYIIAIALFSIFWSAYTVSFFIFVHSALPELSFPHAAGVYMLSWLAGFLVPFAPQGIGVSESFASYLLSGSLAAWLIGLLFSFRALYVLTDVVVWGAYAIATRYIASRW